MVQISLVEAREILSSFDYKLRAYTERLIRKRRSMNILKASVTSENQFHVCGVRKRTPVLFYILI